MLYRPIRFTYSCISILSCVRINDDDDDVASLATLHDYEWLSALQSVYNQGRIHTTVHHP